MTIVKNPKREKKNLLLLNGVLFLLQNFEVFYYTTFKRVLLYFIFFYLESLRRLLEFANIKSY
jgi:hypothetical protein